MAKGMLENRQMWIIDDSDRYRAMKQNEIKNYIDILLELIKIFDNQNEEHVEKFLSRDNDYGRLEQCKVLPLVSETDRNTQLKRIVADCMDDYLINFGKLPENTQPIVEAVKNHPDVLFIGYKIYINDRLVKIEIVQSCIRQLIKVYS